MVGQDQRVTMRAQREGKGKYIWKVITVAEKHTLM